MIILNKKKLKNEYPNINNELCFLFNERFFSKINKVIKAKNTNGKNPVSTHEKASNNPLKIDKINLFIKTVS